MKRNLFTLKMILALFILPLALQAQVLRVGIARDASGNEFDMLVDQTRTEIEALTNAREGVTFIELNAHWHPDSAKKNVASLMNDPKVDVVVCLGFLSSEAAAQLGTHSKPVIAATILDPPVRKVPLQSDGSSGAHDFFWIDSFFRLDEDISSFARIFEFDHLAVLIPLSLHEAYPLLAQQLQVENRPFKVSFIPLDMNEDPMEKWPEGADAALVFPLIYHDATSIEAIFSAFNDQQIPSLAVFASEYLDRGATLSFTPGSPFQQLGRQIAIRVMKAAEGNNLAAFPSFSNDAERNPIINMKSLRLLGKYPDWALLENAVLLNVASIPGEELTLHQAIALALENNLKGKISEQDLLLAEKDIRIAKSNILPQVEISGTGVQLSENLVEASMGQRGEFTITGSVSIKQVIFSEAAYANIALKKLMAENTKQVDRQTTLDIVLEVSQAYISLLFAKNNLIIRNENVSAIMQNLELARARESLGEAGVSDVNRWISEMNLARMDLNDAEAAYATAMFGLNQVLNQPLNNTIATPDSLELSKTILPHQSILDSYFSNAHLAEKYAGFIIREMRTHAPELQQLSAASEMIDRQRTMKVRQMYLPEVALIGSADQAFLREGTIRNPNLPIPPPPDDITWNLGLRVSIPILTGGRKRTEIQRANIEQDRMVWQQENLVLTLERGIRSNVQFLQASYREQKLSKNAALAAEENYLVVRDAYAQGMVNAVQLTDAQAVMIRSRQMALGSQYQYMLDYIKTERLQGVFSFLEDESERALYTHRLLNYLTDEE